MLKNKLNIFCGIVLFLVLIIGNLYNPQKVSAACNLTIKPSSVASDFYSDLEISTNTTCPFPDVNLWVIASKPDKGLSDLKEPDPLLGNNYPSVRTKRANPTTIKTRLDINSGINLNGRSNPGLWMIYICTAGSYVDCKESKNIFGSGNMTVRTEPEIITGNNTPGRHKIALSESTCRMQVGGEAIIKVINATPGRSYSWWWRNENPVLDANTGSLGTITATGQEFEFKITAKEADRSRTETLCVDNGRRAEPQNCIRLSIEAVKPEGDTKCSRTSDNVPACPSNYNGIYKEFRTKSNECPINSCYKPGKGIVNGQNVDGFLCYEYSKIGSNNKVCKSKADADFDPAIHDGDCSSSAGKFCNIEDGREIDSNIYPGKEAQAKGEGGVMTAIGCVPTEPKTLIAGVMKFATAAGGGIALLLMIFGAFQMITSAGNPENLKKGQEQFTSAIIGLLFIIFSTLLLQIIGVDILAIPGFTR